jgi:hypothetical protein
VLETRWSKLPWIKGAITIPIRPQAFKGIIPKLLKGKRVTTSKKNISHIRKTTLKGVAELPQTEDCAIFNSQFSMVQMCKLNG